MGHWDYCACTPIRGLDWPFTPQGPLHTNGNPERCQRCRQSMNLFNYLHFQVQRRHTLPPRPPVVVVR